MATQPKNSPFESPYDKEARLKRAAERERKEAEKLAAQRFCPITGRPLSRDIISGRYFPDEPYRDDQNPPGLNEAIKKAGYDPFRYMERDGAIPVLAYLVVDGERVGLIEPSRLTGNFGGWQVKMLAEDASKTTSILSRSVEMPEDYTLKMCVDWQPSK